VAVTFDDGYRDNFLNALPILKRLGIPATIFLTTGCVQEAKLPWYDQVALAFKLTTKMTLELDASGAPNGAIESAEARIRVMLNFLEWLWGLETEDRERRLPELFDALGVSPGPNLPNFMLNWTEIREMSKNGISFGGHTVTHPVLSHCRSEMVEKEIFESKKSIEQNLKQPVIHFAYPFGRRGDFNEGTKRILRAAGIQTSVTTIPGYNRRGEDLLELKRFTPWGQDLGQFALKMDWHRFRGFTQREQDVTGLFGSAKPISGQSAIAKDSRDVG
jgi:peptidoglycan/xylan/chitin deacetylase (PgdA/CDA1 family)